MKKATGYDVDAQVVVTEDASRHCMVALDVDQVDVAQLAWTKLDCGSCNRRSD